MPEISDRTAAGRLRVATTVRGEARVITVSGEIDHETGAPLREAAVEALAGRVPHLVVDLTSVTFMDSAGLNILLRAHRRAVDAGGWLRLAGVGANVLRILQIVGIDSVIDLYPDAETALA
ncbi:STAS domain-containing protein [Streptomyces sp. NPDC016845]|uniref:STAS domain-containing protein n=1 Tax=Streptomyces sp. NPDC016845 TaxID=3364972 RepID=UPI0037BD4F4B